MSLVGFTRHSWITQRRGGFCRRVSPLSMLTLKEKWWSAVSFCACLWLIRAGCFANPRNSSPNYWKSGRRSSAFLIPTYVACCLHSDRLAVKLVFKPPPQVTALCGGDVFHVCSFVCVSVARNVYLSGIGRTGPAAQHSWQP